MNLTIVLGEKNNNDQNRKIYSTEYNRWQEISRPNLFNNLFYTNSYLDKQRSSIPKIGNTIEKEILNKLIKVNNLKTYRSNSFDSKSIFCHSGGRYFRKCILDKLSNEYKEVKIRPGWEYPLICLLSSSFYYWFWIAISDCYHITSRDIDFLPVTESISYENKFKRLGEALLKDLWSHAVTRTRNRADGSQQQEVNFYVGKSKLILDEIDKVLGEHYGFTDEELDFIINFDIKYRLGAEAEGD